MLRLGPATLLEVLELEVEVARGLAGEDRELRQGRVAVRAVAVDAEFRLLATLVEVLGTDRAGDQRGGECESVFRMHRNTFNQQRGRPQAASQSLPLGAQSG